ncbi:MAG: heavy metal translocating P-type ATPase [Lachnospiraceae bacterium]|nr:heavy metal translocating P-type ATPase [Lachnospiraceae bacterium]
MSDKQKKELRKILIALGVFIVLMVLDKTGTWPAVFGDRWLSLILYMIPYLVCGWPVIRKGVLGIIHHQMFDESFLMLVATIGAIVTGENSEATAVMLFYQVGEWFQDYAVDKSRKSISDLMDIVPEYANLENEDGTVETIDPDDVEVGNVLVIKPGEKIPVDGVVLTGESMVDTKALTGESVPRSVKAGEEIISGCINGEGLLRIRASKAFDDSTVSKILELVENAAEKKSHTENFITRFARVYTPTVVFAALALAVIGGAVTGSWMTWIYRACTFLVISCPCAMVISVPLAFFGGIGASSRNGVLVKGSNYLEQLSMLDTVVSDKTGTMTRGNFKVTDVLPAEGVTREELLRKAAMAEGMSTHPIAVSIRNELQTEIPGIELSTNAVTDTDNITGQGLVAVVGGKKIYVGNARLMEAHGISYVPDGDPAATVSYVAEENKFLGTILIRDEVKPEAHDVVMAMKNVGVRQFVLLTGDRKAVGEAVGNEIGADVVCSELLPQDKVAKVEELLSDLNPEKQKLAFIGDGINDAPVLTRSDIGIAMGSMGSDAAIEAADVVIMDDDLTRIPTVIRISRWTVGIARQNVIFALFVKVLVLILGALGIANMWAAVFADVGVAVLCILNSMRLLTIKKTI